MAKVGFEVKKKKKVSHRETDQSHGGTLFWWF